MGECGEGERKGRARWEVAGTKATGTPGAWAGTRQCPPDGAGAGWAGPWRCSTMHAQSCGSAQHLPTCASREGAHLDLPDLAVPVQREHLAAHHARDVQRHLQRADDAAVAVGQAVLDVVQRGVDEHAVGVPRRALDADGLVHLRVRVGREEEWRQLFARGCVHACTCPLWHTSTHVGRQAARWICRHVGRHGRTVHGRTCPLQRRGHACATGGLDRRRTVLHVACHAPSLACHACSRTPPKGAAAAPP